MRVLWFAAGTAAGVYASTKVRRAAEALTVDGIHDRLTGWFAGARVIGEELRAGALEKETELRGRVSGMPDERGNVLQLRSDPTMHDVTTHDPTIPEPEKGDD